MAKTTLTNLNDSAEFTAAAEMLTDLETRLNFARAELESARGSSDELAAQSEEAAVKALLSGGTAVAAPNLTELAREVRVLERAWETHRRDVDGLAARIEHAQHDVGSAIRAEDDADTVVLIGLLEQTRELIVKRDERRRDVRRRFAGHCTLPELSVAHDFVMRLPVTLSQFKDAARHFGVVGK